MQSKISFFNKTIYLKNMKRFWPVWVGYLILLFFMLPFNTLSQFLNYYKQTGESMSWLFASLLNMTANPVFLSFVSMFAGVIVFSYLFSTRSAYAIHALPVTREELFFTNYLSGFTFLVLPEFIVYVMTALILTGTGHHYHDMLSMWFLMVLLMTFFFYSMIVMLCQFSGNGFWPPVLFYIFNFLYVGLKFMIQQLSSMLLFGLTDSISFTGKDGALSPLYYLMRFSFFTGDENGHITFSSHPKLAWYLVIAVLFIVFAIALNHRRQLESAGDTIAVKFMKPIFQFGVSFCSSLLLLLLVVSIFLSQMNLHSVVGTGVLYLLLLLTTIFSYFAVRMILEKTFKVFQRKSFLQCACLTILLLLIVSLIRFDAFGVIHKFPDPSDVESVTTSFTYSSQTTDPDKIKEVIALHKEIVDSQNQLSSNTGSLHTINLVYHLKDGTKLSRTYNMSLPDDCTLAQDLSSYFNRYDVLMDSLGIQSGTTVTSATGNCDLYTVDSTKINLGLDPVAVETYIFTPDQAQSILAGYLMDVKEGNLVISSPSQDIEDSYDQTYYNQIIIQYDTPQGHRDDNNYYYADAFVPTIHSSQGTLDFAFHITKNCKYTLQALSDAGVDLTKFVTITEYNLAYSDQTAVQ